MRGFQPASRRSLRDPRPVVAFELAVLLVFSASYARTRHPSPLKTWSAAAEAARRAPLSAGPLADDPGVVGDEELLAVLARVRPALPRQELRSNHVEHALRAWGTRSTFDDPASLPGRELLGLLTDHKRLPASWGEGGDSLLIDGSHGVTIRRAGGNGASIHKDHWLACLAEAGADLDQPVTTSSGGARTIRDALRQSLHDFRLDDAEVEWSVMTFGLWLPPTLAWTAADGRRMTFDLLAQRLMRGDKTLGACWGTHRVYSLALLWRLDERDRLLSDSTRQGVSAYLLKVRDRLVASQAEDGHWPPTWAGAVSGPGAPTEAPRWRRLVTTGHHLEWLALVPLQFQPPRERIRQAARWLVAQTLAASDEEIRTNYPYYSHVGNALALWRGTNPADFWSRRPPRPNGGRVPRS